MPNDIAIGLFRTLGDAEDVRNRLLYEGVAAADIELRVLGKSAAIPPELTPQTMESFVDWLFGGALPEKYGILVTNGETAVCVRTRSEEDFDIAADTMRQYAPLDIDRVSPPDEEAFLADQQKSGRSGNRSK